MASLNFQEHSKFSCVHGLAFTDTVKVAGDFLTFIISPLFNGCYEVILGSSNSSFAFDPVKCADVFDAFALANRVYSDLLLDSEVA